MIQSHLKYFIVDAFTRHAFKGNPAAVVVTEKPLPVAMMQSIAAEMNLSETAFAVQQAGRNAGDYSLRWFTPSVEVDLCGHATLATATVLYEEGKVSHQTPLAFTTKSGVLAVTKRQNQICMKFPSQELTTLAECPEPLHPFANQIEYIGRNSWLTVVRLKSEADIRDFQADFNRLKKLNSCLSITAASDHAERDFVSRFFGPVVGIDEDPVTGAAHCALGPYWCRQLGKASVCGEQISKRGGIVHVEWELDAPDLILSGQAVLVAKGFLLQGL